MTADDQTPDTAPTADELPDEEGQADRIGQVDSDAPAQGALSTQDDRELPEPNEPA